jgi:hypothetical protein
MDINDIIRKVKGEFAAEGESAQLATRALEMGQRYRETRRFDNSRYYHNYQFQLEDGSKVSSHSFFSIYTTRNQTGAYLDAEKAVREACAEAGAPLDKAREDALFHMVRDQRFGINGVFKAVLSPSEPQQISYTDYVLIIAAFCAGALGAV